MDVLRLNTTPTLEVVTRKTLELSETLSIKFTNENTQSQQDILVDTVEVNSNETYFITLQSSPNGKQGDKFSYVLTNTFNDEVLVMGKALIASETESIQDYTKANNNKFYK